MSIEKELREIYQARLKIAGTYGTDQLLAVANAIAFQEIAKQLGKITAHLDQRRSEKAAGDGDLSLGSTNIKKAKD